MTPQLMQAIKLLQLSNLDLVAYVEAELERNPLLDRNADDEQGPVEAGASDAPDSPAAEGETWEASPSEPSRSAMEDALDATHRPPDRVAIAHVGLNGSQPQIRERSEVRARADGDDDLVSPGDQQPGHV